MSGEYDQYLSNYYSQNTARLEWNAAIALDHHGRHFPADRGAAILEIGPGTGTMIGFLRSHCGYQNIKAVDISSEVVNACNTILPGSTELVEDSAAYLENHTAEFDFVLMLHTLEHIPKDKVMPLLKAIRLALRPGGKLVVEAVEDIGPVDGL